MRFELVAGTGHSDGKPSTQDVFLNHHPIVSSSWSYEKIQKDAGRRGSFSSQLLSAHFAIPTTHKISKTVTVLFVFRSELRRTVYLRAVSI